MATPATAQITELFPGIHAETPGTSMRVRKRNGSLEAVSVDKIIRAVERSSVGLSSVDPMRVAIKTIGGLYDGSTTKELDSLSIQTAASLIAEEPEYSRLAARVTEMIREAVDCELTFAQDTLSMGVTGLSIQRMGEYLEYVADRRLVALGLPPIYGSQNPFAFMALQDVQELTNFFERRVSAYQVGVTGEVEFAVDF